MKTFTPFLSLFAVVIGTTVLLSPCTISAQSIVSVSPDSGNAGQTLNLTIKGSFTNFKKDSDVMVYTGIPSAIINTVTVTNDTLMVASLTISSATYTGLYGIEVYDSKDEYMDYDSGFFVNGITHPSLTGLSPDTGNAGQTLNVTIYGSNTNFKQSGTELFMEFPKEATINSTTVTNDTTMIVNLTIPSDEYTGTYPVEVYDDLDGYIYYNQGFYVNGILPPSLKDISPDTGNAGQTLNVTIYGSSTNFTQSETEIYFEFPQEATINSTTVKNDSTVIVNLSIPSNEYTGTYGVEVYDEQDGELDYYNGFYINGVLPPSLKDIAPDTGNAGQTLNVTIYGSSTNFKQSETDVYFDFPQEATINSTTVRNDSTVIVNLTIPSNEYTGTYYVSVSDDLDGELDYYNGFYINGVLPPSIKDIAPDTGNAGQTLNVTIYGSSTNFTQSETDVYFDFPQEATINSTTVKNDSTVIVNLTIPSNELTGTYFVEVSDDLDGELDYYNGFYINGVLPPSIKNIAPDTGNAGQTLNVTIYGSSTNFTQSETDVYFEFPQEATINSIDVTNDSTMIVNLSIPSNELTGTYFVEVSDDLDGELDYYNGFYINGVLPPSLKDISPDTGNAGQTLNVTIYGSSTNFTQSETDVYFEFPVEATINSINVTNDSTVIVNLSIPSNEYTGNYDVEVFDELDGELDYYNGFYINGVLPPSLTDVSPDTGNAGQTLNVTITGAFTNFNDSNTTVYFGFLRGDTINSLSVVNDSVLIANVTIPSNTVTDNYEVEVYDELDGELDYYPGFYVNGVLPPSIKDITPDTGNAGQTLNVTIYGSSTNFNDSNTSVYFEFPDGGTINSLTVQNDSVLIVNLTIPANTYTGTYYVEVYDELDGYLYYYNGFYVNGILPASLTNVSPDAGNSGQTLNVAITGLNSNFNQYNTEVYFGFGSSINSIDVINDTSLVANVTIPSNTGTGYYYVEVYDELDGELYYYNEFYVTHIPASVAIVTPDSAHAGQTLAVTITGIGTNFLEYGTTVNFGFLNGGTVNSLNVINDTSMIADVTIPANTYTGTYNVEVYDDEDGYLYYSKGFYVNALAASIINISPDSAMAGQTLDVYISGANTYFAIGSATSVAFTQSYSNAFTINSYNLLSDTSMMANITIPGDADTGFYDIHVSDYIDGDIYKGNAFRIVTITGIEELGKAGDILNVYPNPFNDKFTIELSLTQAADVRLDLMDIDGRIISSVNYGMKDAGMQQFVFSDNVGIADGIIIARLDIGGTLLYRKITHLLTE